MNAIDTNVWLYSHDTRDPHKQGIAQQLIATMRPLALPWQVGCEYCGFLHGRSVRRLPD
jgi:predicted nucleic acid-binding protein